MFIGGWLEIICHFFAVSHTVGMGHDWISTGFLSQNGRQAALKRTQASSPQGLNVEMQAHISPSLPFTAATRRLGGASPHRASRFPDPRGSDRWNMMELCPAWVSHFNSRCPGFLMFFVTYSKGDLPWIYQRTWTMLQICSEALQKRLDANMHKWILEVGHCPKNGLVSSIGYGRVWSRLDPGKNVGVKLTSKQSTLKESLSGRRRP